MKNDCGFLVFLLVHMISLKFCALEFVIPVNIFLFKNHPDITAYNIKISWLALLVHQFTNMVDEQHASGKHFFNIFCLIYFSKLFFCSGGRYQRNWKTSGQDLPFNLVVMETQK